MKNTLAFLYLMALPLLSINAIADDIIIEIEEARIHATSNMKNGSVAYMHIVNFSENRSIELTAASTHVAADLEILSPAGNQTTILIEPGEAVNLEPKGYMIRLNQLQQPIIKGQKILLKLSFAHGETYLVDAIAVKPGTHLHEDGSQHKDH